jgi:hypothetical protein
VDELMFFHALKTALKKEFNGGNDQLNDGLICVNPGISHKFLS